MHLNSKISFKFWTIAKSTKLVYLQVNLCILRPETQEGEDVLPVYRMCYWLRVIFCIGCYVCEFPRLPSESDLLACFPSLEQCISHLVKSDSGLHDVITKCQELRCAGWLGQLIMDSYTTFLCSKLSHICIDPGESLIHDYISEGSVSISTCNEHNYALLQQKFLKSSRDNNKK